MVEVFNNNTEADVDKSQEIIQRARVEEGVLKEWVEQSLKDKMKDYFEKNIAVDWQKVDFNNTDMSFAIEQDPNKEKRMYLVYNNRFDWFGLQSDKISKVKVAFDVVTEKNNYYVKFDTKSSEFTKDVTVTWTELLVWDIIYDFTIPNEKQKTTDVRMAPNAEKTTERIKKRVEGFEFKSLVNIKNKPEFENTQLTWLNNLSFGKEIKKEAEWYSRTVYLFDTARAKYLPIAKIYFDKLWHLDKVNTKKAYTEQAATKPLKVLGQVLSLDMKISKDKKWLEVWFTENSLKWLETRVQAHREKLISYVDQAKIAPWSQFNEFDKTDKERPWHKGEKKFLFDTANLKLDIMNDTYTFDSPRKDEQDIKFGFDFADKANDDKIYIRDFKWVKLNPSVQFNGKWDIKWVKNAFDIKVDDNNIYSVFDNSGKLTIYKSDKAVEKTGETYPKLSWDWAKYVKKETLRYYDNENKKMQYFDEKEWKKIVEIPTTANDKSEWKLDKVSENVRTNSLIDMTKFDATKLQKLNLNGEDMKNVFFLLMKDQDIKLQWRESVSILTDAKTWKIEYYKPKQSVTWEPINLEKDKELYDTADKVMKLMLKRLEIIDKIENVQLLWINKWKEERFEWAVWWGRWLEKSSLTTPNKTSFLIWTTNILSQKILRWEGDASSVEYKIKKNWEFGFDVKDSKAVKLEWTWFLKKKLSPKLDIQNYKMSFEFGSAFKLKFDPVE